MKKLQSLQSPHWPSECWLPWLWLRAHPAGRPVVACAEPWWRLAGGEGAAKDGSAIGAVAGATRTVAQNSRRRERRECGSPSTPPNTSQARRSQNVQSSNFNEATPEVLVSTPPAASAAQAKRQPISARRFRRCQER